MLAYSSCKLTTAWVITVYDSIRLWPLKLLTDAFCQYNNFLSQFVRAISVLRVPVVYLIVCIMFQMWQSVSPHCIKLQESCSRAIFTPCNFSDALKHFKSVCKVVVMIVHIFRKTLFFCPFPHTFILTETLLPGSAYNEL